MISADVAYRAVFEHTTDAVFIGTSDGVIIAANPAACATLGRTEAEICALGRQGILQASPELTAAVAQRQATGRMRSLLTFIRGDGSLWRADVTSTLFTEDGGVKYAVVTARDVSELVRLEEAAEASRAALDAIVDDSIDYIFSVDIETHRLLWFNTTFADFMQNVRGIDVAIGMGPEDLYPDPAYVQQWHGFFDRARREGSFTSEYESYAGNRVMEMRMRCVPDRGEPTAITVFGRDVTDQRQALAALADSEQKYRSVVESMAEGVVIQLADGRIVETNRAAQEIEGRSDDDMQGHTSDDEMWGAVHEDGTPFPGEEHPSMVTLRTGEPQLNVVMGVRRPSGERRWLSINSAPVSSGDGGVLSSVVTTFHDITDRKRAQDAVADNLRRLQAIMQQTLEAVARMVELRDPYTSGHMERVGMVAHDIGMEMGWSEARCRMLRYAGMVHDVGKIAVPVEVLTKPTRLTDLEMELVRSHAEWSYEILKDIDFPDPIAANRAGIFVYGFTHQEVGE